MIETWSANQLYQLVFCIDTCSSWIDLIKIIKGYMHELRVWIVNWERPPPNTYQFKTDGSALSKTGKICRGGILRDSQGDMI